jgi:hypothetical protein
MLLSDLLTASLPVSNATFTNHNIVYEIYSKVEENQSLVHKKSLELFPVRGFNVFGYGEGGGARTHDLRLKRPLLYRLSYPFGTGKFPKT